MLCVVELHARDALCGTNLINRHFRCVYFMDFNAVPVSGGNSSHIINLITGWRGMVRLTL
jgi:hypothetical protein